MDLREGSERAQEDLKLQRTPFGFAQGRLRYTKEALPAKHLECSRRKRTGKNQGRPSPRNSRETTAGLRFPDCYCCGGACWSGAPWPWCCPHCARWACISSHFFCWLESRRPRICVSVVLRISIILARRSS